MLFSPSPFASQTSRFYWIFLLILCFPFHDFLPPLLCTLLIRPDFLKVSHWPEGQEGLPSPHQNPFLFPPTVFDQKRGEGCRSLPSG